MKDILAMRLQSRIAPLRGEYEDGRAVLDSLIEVVRDDHTETLKILNTGLGWVKLALQDPEKFIADTKSGRIKANTSG